MSLQTSDSPVAPSAQVVANAFVEQYYHILHHSPELVYRFYQDSSVLSRQAENGEMTSVTTMQGINAKILSLDYTNYKAEIKTADAQDSYNDGVIVLVTGCLTGKDNLRKKFAQSFFLAPQSKKGYFVLNDVFRYVDECEPLETNVVPIAKDYSGSVPIAAEKEPLHVPRSSIQEVASANEVNQIHVDKSTQSLEKEQQVANEEEVPAISQSTENHIPVLTESTQILAQDDGAKNSYASIVKKANDSPGTTKVYVPTTAVKSAPRGTQEKTSKSVPPTSAAEASVESRIPESTNTKGVESHSIFVRNLPINATVAQLEREFKRFGPITQDGVQVRSNRQQGSCYGFVEFLDASSVGSAMQASPIMFEGRQAFVEIKKTTTRVEGGRGRFPFGRGGFRGDNFRGHGGYGGGVRGFGGREEYSSGGRGFGGREEYSSGGHGFGGRGEYFGGGRGQAGRGVDGSYQRGRGRGGHEGGINRTNVTP